MEARSDEAKEIVLEPQASKMLPTDADVRSQPNFQLRV